MPHERRGGALQEGGLPARSAAKMATVPGKEGGFRRAGFPPVEGRGHVSCRGNPPVVARAPRLNHDITPGDLDPAPPSAFEKNTSTSPKQSGGRHESGGLIRG